VHHGGRRRHRLAFGGGVVGTGGLAASAGSQLQLPVILRRACQGTTTLSQNSRVAMIEIAIENGMTK
jgi:hypothetical protein